MRGDDIDEYEYDEDSRGGRPPLASSPLGGKDGGIISDTESRMLFSHTCHSKSISRCGISTQRTYQT
jgi:hypothetical protein